MAEYGPAAKRHRQSLKARFHNRSIRSRVRTARRSFLQAIESNDKELAEQRFRQVAKLIDTAAGKGVFHKNTASRTKSRLQKKLNSLVA